MGYGDYNYNLPEGENLVPDAERVEALRAILLAPPFHFGRPYDDVGAWEKVAQSRAGRKMMSEALALAAEPFVPHTNELYLHTNETQNRERVDPVIPKVRSRLALYPIAECMEREGRFLPLIEREIEAILEVKTWNFPLHDPDQKFYQGLDEWVDLTATQFAANLTHALHLLEGKLNPGLQERIPAEIERRIFAPFEKRIVSGQDVWWWIPCEHNWNSVCLAEILSCALRLKSDPQERAWYMALVEKLIEHSEEGFAESGFYLEGVSYWGYGFSHYLLANELMGAVTGGEIDLLRKPKSERISHFGSRMEIQDGVYPSFSDCDREASPPQWLMAWQNNRRDPNRKERHQECPIDPVDPPHFQFAPIVAMLLFQQEDVDEAYGLSTSTAAYDWFPDAQFLISRPGPESKTRLAATFKGGDNGVNHSHNDLGTFTVLIGRRELLADPGKEVYHERTFSKYRYECDLLNSFGHPVPVVGGELQRPGKDEHNSREGRKYHANVVDTAFTETCDRVILDLSKAYTVEKVEQLERNFSYHRGETEKVVVTDLFRYAQPGGFETALITFEPWVLREDGTLLVGDEEAAVSVQVETSAGELEFDHCVIQESSTPTRLCWRLKEPVVAAEVTLTVQPAP